MSVLRRLLYAAVVLVLSSVGSPSVPSATAVDQSKGYPGFCKDAKGVTVVIDFQALGGQTIVRCNPSGERGTGLDALKGAGIQVAGVQRWGESFICRIENRPSAVENVHVDTDPNYREQCINTPPAKAYWSYWHAGNNCAWHYGQWGVKNRDFVPGGFEGWSFSLNASADTNPKPRIAAVRPGTEGGACVEKAEAKPSTNDPNERQPGSVVDNGYVPDPDHGKDGVVGDDPFDPDRPGGSQPYGSEQRPSAVVGGQPPGTPSGSRATASPGSPVGGVAGEPSKGQALPAPKPRATGTVPLQDDPADDPADNMAFTGGERSPDVRDVVKKQSNASDLAPWAAGAAMAMLGGLALLTARRRRRLRGDD